MGIHLLQLMILFKVGENWAELYTAFLILFLTATILMQWWGEAAKLRTAAGVCVPWEHPQVLGARQRVLPTLLRALLKMLLPGPQFMLSMEGAAARRCAEQ